MTLRQIAERYGLTSDGVDFALSQYQIVIFEITHGLMSKLSYYAKDIIQVAQERWCDTCDLKALSGWISVKDRLPEEHESIFYKLLGTTKWSNAMWKQESEKVLVYVSFPDGTGIVTTGCLHNSDWITTVSKALPQTVTHWMPLPEPPVETTTGKGAPLNE